VGLAGCAGHICNVQHCDGHSGLCGNCSAVSLE
jgi:hypothetical protein